MFQSETKLPQLLSADAYFGERAYRAELDQVLRASWHVVGTTAELSRHGDFLTCEIAETPIQVRNFNGQITALSNVCAHRHCLISSQTCGNSGSMQCQYHGWEYQSDGTTGKIPQPKNFVPFDRETLRLEKYCVAQVGQLVFVSLSSSPEPIDSFLGPEMYKKIQERFGEKWILSLKWQPSYPANWKVPVENSLEAYHVPCVHPETFREDPGPARCDHWLDARRTSMKTQLPFSPHSRLDGFFQKTESRFVRWLGIESTNGYEQHHLFPNLLFSFTDAISLVNCILPTGPKSSVATVRQFGRGPIRGGWAKSRIAKLWSKLTASITKKILLEDLEIFEAIQHGFERSSHVGVLGACEERIHAFQVYLQQKQSKSSDR